MSPRNRFRRGVVRLVSSLAALLFCSAVAAFSNLSAPLPDTGQAEKVESFRGAPGLVGARQLRLDMVDIAAITVAKAANSQSGTKILQVGVGREVAPSPEARSTGLSWVRVAGGRVAHWEVTSPAAVALRIGLSAAGLPPGVELRFAGSGGNATVYGPFTFRDVANGDPVYWSPVLEGESAVVELFAADWVSPASVDLTVSQVSHLFANPADANMERMAKDGSQFCEIDFICRSATDPALATMGRSVARMSFVKLGISYVCTGTLLNPIGGSFIPYFFTANHCLENQTVANTLTTHWFYDRTGCGTGVTSSSYRQLTGGAALLYGTVASDAMLLRLNAAPPAGAVFAGWTAATLSGPTAFTAIHHPAGDWKKVSLGTFGGFSAYGGGPGSDRIIALWNSISTGVTEGGSSGSGIFTAVGSPATDYQIRGGLHGGPSSCSATGTGLRDYYSRFDQAYPSMSQYLNPPVSCTYSLSPTSQSVGAGATQGSFTVTTSTGCAWSAVSNAAWITTSSSGSGSGTVVYTVATNTGVARSGTITAGGQTFTVSQAAAAVSASTRLINISTRGQVLTGDNVMIGGFVIGGTSPKTVLITARGPSLTAFGVPGALPDPVLTLFSGGTAIATNDDVIFAPNYSAILATGVAPTNGLESAILVTLNPGAYTAIVSGYLGATGVGIVEAFEISNTSAPLVNISTRGQVLTGDNVMIGGFVITGTSPRTMLITARGPSLTAFGVPGALSDPVLTLYSGGTAIATNDDVIFAPNYSAILATGVAPTNSLESAILVTLSPGAYTAIVSGYLGATGVGIVEVFAQ